MGEAPGEIKWISKSQSSTSSDCVEKPIEPKYSLFGERIRHVAPTNLQCQMFCGGKQCKYCNASKFKDSEMAIKGLYSSWVTDKILATSRPTTVAMKEHSVIKQFKEQRIASIINLQHPGEHASCGFGLEELGFSYIPQEFMDNDVFFYNFGWNDYGVRSLQSILDMVKVMDFALSNGKVAIHCHAGLGRTGVLIACYLIYANRMSHNEAILKVRESRPKAIQTRGQICCVKEFENYIRPMWVLFTEDGDNAVSLECLMAYQRNILHGEEARSLKYVPKIINMICQRLLVLSDIKYDLSNVTQITRFNFMVSSPLNAINLQEPPSPTLSDENSSKDNDPHCKTVNENLKSFQPISNNETKSDNEEKDISFGCISEEEDAEVMTTQKVKSKKTKSRNKKNTQSDVEESDNVIETETLSKLKKAGALEPIKRKTKKKTRTTKKKNDIDLSELNTSEIQDIKKPVNSIHGDSDDESNTSELEGLRKPVNSIHGDSDSEDVLTTTAAQFRCSSVKYDNISLASFSSTANEGLSANEIALKYLAFRCADVNVVNQIERYKRKLNACDEGWLELQEETNLAVLSGLLWSWLAFVKEPIIDKEHIDIIKENLNHPLEAVKKFSRDVWKLIECFLTVILKLNGRVELYDLVLRRFAVVMTAESIPKKMETGNEMDITDDKNGIIFLKFIKNYATILKKVVYQ